MRNAFWNERYGGEEYAYGTEPNRFVADALPRLLPPPARVVDVGSGEGRNAVWAASAGYAVTAVDASTAGLDKTRRLAERRGVTVEGVHADLRTWAPEEPFDVAIVVFIHLASAERMAFWSRLRTVVRPGGWIIGEWFAPRHVVDGLPGGGPRDVDRVPGLDELREAFDGGRFDVLDEVRSVLDEGPFHRGAAVTVRLAWQRP